MTNEEKAILDRIDQLIDATHEQTSTIFSIERRIENLEDTTNGLDQMLRGDKSTVGLITDVAVMKATMNQVSTPPPEKTPTGPSWKWVADNYTAIAIPIILWLVLTILPDILSNIKNALP